MNKFWFLLILTHPNNSIRRSFGRLNMSALVSGMTAFYHIGTLSRLYETLKNRVIVDPTPHSLCGVVGRADGTPIEI